MVLPWYTVTTRIRWIREDKSLSFRNQTTTNVEHVPLGVTQSILMTHCLGLQVRFVLATLRCGGKYVWSVTPV